MPTSRPHHLTWLANKIIELKPKSILDVGIGFGGKGMLFREYTDIWNGRYNKEAWKTKIDGIEIFKDYIGNLQKEIYDEIFIGDINEKDIKVYDLIYLGDVIEHINKEEGKDLIKYLNSKCKNLIIATPIDVRPQGDVFGNKHEQHVSQWGFEDFKGAQVGKIGGTLIAHYKYNLCVYYCPGMSFFGKCAIKNLGMKPYNPDASCFFVGLYEEEDYNVLEKPRVKSIVFWNGSDVLRLMQRKDWQNRLKKVNADHYCHNETLKNELETLGIKAIVKPLFFGDLLKYKTSFNPGKTTNFYMIAHPGREEEYGVNQVIRIADQIEDVKFHIYGVNGKSTDKVKFYGVVDEEVMDDEIKYFQCCIRLNKHDGISQTVMKSMLMGHYVIYESSDQEFIEKAKDIKKRESYNNQIKEVCNLIKDRGWIYGY